MKSSTEDGAQEICEICNFFHEDPEFRCIGCAPKNNRGLHLKFLYDKGKDEVLVRPELSTDLCSFNGLLHGGILATYFDEVAYFCVLMRKPRVGLTTHMAVQYKEPVRLGNKAELEVRGRVKSEDEKGAIVELRAIQNGRTCATAEVSYAFPPDKVSTKVLGESKMKWLQPYLASPMRLMPPSKL